MYPIINIKWNTLKETKSSISFDDKYHHYSFNKSKSMKYGLYAYTLED